MAPSIRCKSCAYIENSPPPIWNDLPPIYVLTDFKEDIKEDIEQNTAESCNFAVPNHSCVMSKRFASTHNLGLKRSSPECLINLVKNKIL